MPMALLEHNTTNLEKQAISAERFYFDEFGFRQVLERASNAILLGQDPVKAAINVVSKVPQMRNGQLDYLINSGIAIALYTQRKRRHRDVDLVVLSDQFDHHWHARKIDVRTSGRFWCQMHLPHSFLRATARKMPVNDRNSVGLATELWLVHPAIILVQKCADHKGLPPRAKDVIDANFLIEDYYLRNLHESEEWRSVIRFSISTLPTQERQTTRARIKALELEYEALLI